MSAIQSDEKLTFSYRTRGYGEKRPLALRLELFVQTNPLRLLYSSKAVTTALYLGEAEI